jgi:hypothetical protein
MGILHGTVLTRCGLLGGLHEGSVPHITPVSQSTSLRRWYHKFAIDLSALRGHSLLWQLRVNYGSECTVWHKYCLLLTLQSTNFTNFQLLGRNSTKDRCEEAQQDAAHGHNFLPGVSEFQNH